MDIWVASPLAVVNSAAVSTGVQVSIQVPISNSFRCVLRGGINRCYGDSMFNFLRICHTI